jgi:hypothetical protein
MKNLLLFALPLLLLASGCDDPINPKINTAEPYVVLDGFVDDQPDTRDTIRLTSTVGYLDQGKLPPIVGATVTLSTDGGTPIALPEERPGKYLAPADFVGVEGSTYTLDVMLQDGTKFKAAATMPRGQSLDSITTIVKKDNFPFEDGKYVGVWFKERVGKGDNFIFELVKNDTLQNLPQDLFAVNDDLTDGQEIKGPVLNNKPYKTGDSITVRVVSITKDAVYFYSELATQSNNGGLFSQPPANVRTNFVNVSPGSKKRTTGYFFLRNITSADMVVK